MAHQQSNPFQIRLDEIFNVQDLLKSRGLIPKLKYQNIYDLLKGLEIVQPDFIGNDIEVPFSNFKSNLLSGSIDPMKMSSPERRKFSDKFEWFAAESLKRELSGYSYALGLSLQGRDDLGDYDAIITMRDLSFVYAECKSGSFTAAHILKTINRANNIYADSSVIFYMRGVTGRIIATLIGSQPFPLTGTVCPLEQLTSNLGRTIYKWNNCYFIGVSNHVDEDIRLYARAVAFRKYGMSYVVDNDYADYEEIGITISVL